MSVDHEVTIDRNSYGERLYTDTEGAKCNIRGMIRREPEWVASRFEHMMDKMDQIAALRERVAELLIACKAGRTCAYHFAPADSPEVLQAINRMNEAIEAAEAAAKETTDA